MLSPNKILLIRIVEYATNLVLGYFKDTLANVGLPEAWLEWDSNSLTVIELENI